LVRLGADILFCLPDLISIKLLGPKPQEDANAERCPAFIRSANRIPGLATSVGSPNTSSVGRIHPRRPISQSLFHDVHSNGGIGLTQSGSDFHDDHDLDFTAEDFESAMLDRELDEVRLGGGVNVATSSQGFSSSSSPFQNNRPGLWTPHASSSRHSTATAFSSSSAQNSASSSFSTFQSSSNSGRPTKKKQDRTEKRESKSPEPASPLSQAELGDYLVGWNRYCPSLRMVQIDRRWWWERRFAGDPWALHVVKRSSSSNKGKEREGTFA